MHQPAIGSAAPTALVVGALLVILGVVAATFLYLLRF